MADLGILRAFTGDPPQGGSAAVVDLPRRKPGRPKGVPKIPGSGRKRGSVNRTTAELRAMIHRLADPVRTICRVAAGKETVEGLSRADALRLLYRATVPELRAEIVTGEDGGPVRHVNVIEDARKLAEAFTALPADKPLTGDLLEAAKIVAFGRELAKRNLADDARAGQVQTTEAPARPSTVPHAGARIAPQRQNGGAASDASAAANVAVESAAAPPAPPADISTELPRPQPPEILKFAGTSIAIYAFNQDRPNLPPLFSVKDGPALIHTGRFESCIPHLEKMLGTPLPSHRIESPVSKPPEFEPPRPDQRPSAPVRPQVLTRRPR